MDYQEFYNLKEHPFSSAVDNRFYYPSPQHAEAITRLKYAIDTRKGLAVVVGDIGTGKTTLAMRMLEELDEGHYEAALLILLHSSVTMDWLAKKIAVQLGVRDPADDRADILRQIYERLIEIYEAGLKVVILMDEVQMLQSHDIMREFRGLLNMEIPEGKLITFVLFGLPELEGFLSLDEPLRQRVALKYRLKAFTGDITEDYIRHRLRVAGSGGDIFTPDAMKAIYLCSNGIPRLINTVCDNALLEGFILKRKEINRDIIESVALNLGLEIEEEKAERLKPRRVVV